MLVEVSSPVDAPPTQVWDRVTTAEGIDDELRPWVSMRMPRRWAGRSLDQVPVGEPLGRAWLWLFGVLPCEYDDLKLVEVTPGRGFREQSQMFALSSWGHERTLTPLAGGRTVVSDRLTFEPRRVLRPVAPVIERLVHALFNHRHRRLQRHFAVVVQ